MQQQTHQKQMTEAATIALTLLKVKPELVKQFVNNNKVDVLVNEIMPDFQKLEECKQLNQKIKDQFIILDKLLTMAQDQSTLHQNQ